MLHLKKVVEGISLELTVVPENRPYSIWQLVEHIRIRQWDILEFCCSANHIPPKWPDGKKVSKAQWEHTLLEIKKDRNQFISLLKDDANSLTEPFPLW